MGLTHYGGISPLFECSYLDDQIDYAKTVTTATKPLTLTVMLPNLGGNGLEEARLVKF